MMNGKGKIKKKIMECYGKIICVLFVKIIYGHREGEEGWKVRVR